MLQGHPLGSSKVIKVTQGHRKIDPAPNIHGFSFQEVSPFGLSVFADRGRLSEPAAGYCAQQAERIAAGAWEHMGRLLW